MASMLLIAAACSQAGHEEADTVSIIPQPRYVQMDEGTFRMTNLRKSS